MADLTIRDLPDSVRDALLQRAQQNGRSLELEARATLTDSINSKRASGDKLEDRVARAQAYVARSIPPGSFTVDDFLAEKRAEEAFQEERSRRRHGTLDRAVPTEPLKPDRA